MVIKFTLRLGDETVGAFERMTGTTGGAAVRDEIVAHLEQWLGEVRDENPKDVLDDDVDTDDEVVA